MMTRCQTAKIINWLKNESDDFEESAGGGAVIGTFVDDQSSDCIFANKRSRQMQS